jgi:hypothetical protein
MVLMNIMLLKHTYKTYQNRDWLGRWITAWAFFEVNDNQPINLFENQIMICIICHNKTTFPEILAIYTRCKRASLHTINLMA